LNQEEILVRLGVDSSAVGSQLARVGSEVAHVGEHIQRGLMKGLIFHPLIQLAEQAFHKLTEYIADSIFDNIYHVNHAFGEILDTWRERLHKENKKRWEREKVEEELFKKFRENEKIVAERRDLDSGVDPNSEKGHLQKIARLKEEKRLIDVQFVDEVNHHKKITEIIDTKVASNRVDLEIAREQNTLKKDREEAEKKHHEKLIELGEKLTDIEEKRFKLNQEAAINRRKETESYMPSLQELRQSGWQDMWGIGHAGPFANAAAQIMQLEERAKQQFIYGNVRGANASVDERNQRYDQLAKFGIVPQRSAIDAQVKMAQTLEDLAAQRRTLLVKANME